MTYANEILKQRNDSIFLVKMRAGFLDYDETWVLHTGTTYYIAWPYSDELISTYTKGASKDTLATGEYIIEDGNLYYSFPGPPGFPVAISFDIYLASNALYWYRDPTDVNSGIVYYRPAVLRSPNFTQSIENLQDGWFEITSSALQINNADKWFNQFLHHYVSFNRRPLRVWHMIGPQDVSNIKPIFRGFTGDLNYTGNEVSITTYFEIAELDKQIQPSSNDFRYTSSNSNIFPNTATVDPTKEGIFIGEVYGFARNIPCTNISYNTAESTSVNRTWGVCAGRSGKDATGIWTEMLVAAAPASTTTNTFVDDLGGLQIGDTVYFVDLSEYKLVTNVDFLNNAFSHSALAAPSVTNDRVRLGRVGRLSVVHEGKNYLCMYQRDYTTPEPAGALKHTAIEFVSNFESNVGMPTPLSVNDTVLAEHVFGTMDRATISAVPFGDLTASSYGTNTKSEALIYLLLRNAGIAESDINTASFTTLAADVDNVFPCGFRNPPETTSIPITFKEAITKLLVSSTLFLYFDNDLKWSIGRINTFTYNSSTDKKADTGNILNGSLTVSYKYGDIYSSTIVKHSFREVGVFEQRAQWERIELLGDVAVLLHLAPKSKEIESYLLSPGNAALLAQRMQDIYDNRKAIITINSFFEFFDQVISDTIRIEKDDMPGFPYVRNTLRNIDTKVISIGKNSSGITLLTSDYKSVQTNPGDF